MKKITNMIALVLVLTMCIGVMTACSGNDENSNPSTTAPSVTKPADNKPGTTKPDTNKPGTTKPETNKPGTTKPEADKDEETKPEQSSKPSNESDGK